MDRKEMRWTKLAVICVVALAVFLFGAWQVSLRSEELRAREATLVAQLSGVEKQQEELQIANDQVGSESYIENRARTDYQYVKPGELRFEIINPDALYDSLQTPADHAAP